MRKDFHHHDNHNQDVQSVIKNLKSAKVREDFPAPVLPTIPTRKRSSSSDFNRFIFVNIKKYTVCCCFSVKLCSNVFLNLLRSILKISHQFTSRNKYKIAKIKDKHVHNCQCPVEGNGKLLNVLVT